MLTTGTRLGVYEVASLLGKGGMGEVYRARDTRLGRDVALKVIPEIFAADRDRLARFEREAQVLASLTHANIAAIYGIEESRTADGRATRALVLELVEGDTLADRLLRGPIPLEEALPIARQIADALEAAHERGVVHRDLKPGNVKVTSAGVVKVLDFGLAKAMDSAGGAAGTTGHDLSLSPTFAPSLSPTIAMPGVTVAGIILGTAAYMAPEQAKGRPADRRSDLWAFGCVLFEMLTGRPVFAGEDVSEILAEVIKAHVAWERLPPDTPPSVRRLLRRCLVKDPKARIADAGVARLEIDDAVAPVDGHTQAPAVPASRGPSRLYPAAAGLLLGALGAGAVALGTNRDTGEVLQPTRFSLTLPAGVQLVTNSSQRLALVPDGRRLFYTGVSGDVERLYVHSLDQLDPVAVPGIEGDLGSLFPSPDGEWIGYNDARAGQFKKIRTAGGPPATICDVPAAAGGFAGASWGGAETIAFALANVAGLMSVPESGGVPEPLTMPKDEQHRQPSFLPNGRAIFFTIFKGSQPSQVAVLSLADGRWKRLVQGSSPRFSPSGHLVFLREAALWAVAFDPDTLEARGDAVPVLEGIGLQGNNNAVYSIAANGTLAYSPTSSSEASRTLVWVDRSGREEAIPAPPRAYARVRLSPDGSTIALEARDQEDDIWLWHLARRTLTRLTFGRAQDRAPIWTPDGSRIVFSSDRGGSSLLFWQPADGTGSVEQLTTTGQQIPDSVAADGSLVLSGAEASGGPPDILTMRLPGAPTQREVKPAFTPLVKTDRAELRAAISPDGRWLAYESNPSGGANQVFVRPYPDVSGGLWQVSSGAGRSVQWSRDSRELFFIDGGSLMRVNVAPGPGWAASVQEPVVKGPYAFNTLMPYDVSPDGKRFVMLKDGQTTATQPTGPAIVVVERWTEELRRLVK